MSKTGGSPLTCAAIEDDLLAVLVERGVQGGVPPKRPGDRLHDEGKNGDPHPLAFADLPHLRALGQETRDVGFVHQQGVGNAGLRGHHLPCDHPASPLEGDPLLRRRLRGDARPRLRPRRPRHLLLGDPAAGPLHGPHPAPPRGPSPASGRPGWRARRRRRRRLSRRRLPVRGSTASRNAEVGRSDGVTTCCAAACPPLAR